MLSALDGMYIRISKRIARGALTNGHEWIFVILYLNEDGVGIGGTYATSPPIKIQVSESYPFRVLSPGPDIVVGILADWVRRIVFPLVSEPSRREFNNY